MRVGVSDTRRGCGGLVGMILTMVFLGIAGFWLFTSLTRVNNQSTATGVVVDIAIDRDSDGTTYRPVIEFSTAAGETHRITGRVGTSSRPDIGSTIDVLYDPADPGGATEKTFSNLWLFPLIFGGVGLIVLVATIAARIRGSRSTAPVPEGSAGAGDGDNYMSFDELFNLPADTGPAPAGPPQPWPVAPVAEFRRAEASISPDGTIRYRIIAKDEAGQEFYSELLEEDPTGVILRRRGNELPLVERGGRWVVHYEPPDE